MKNRFSFRAFLHTRLGMLLWTLIVAMLAYEAGQMSNQSRAVIQACQRLLT
ncbi:hypothetical protein NDR89_03320 [Cupriavidus gilardii]|uniref:Sensor histidine kinase n=1 Tax=Cupriavidus gilardii TaxID=82541 RepID=A0ABY4VLJ4_9BURK|nr:hypothetical protein [Cupriavidus gilardii]USE78091.1 hypothetical protein NDR89_03320 [Cupriavidus gilardii]